MCKQHFTIVIFGVEGIEDNLLHDPVFCIQNLYLLSIRSGHSRIDGVELFL